MKTAFQAMAVAVATAIAASAGFAEPLSSPVVLQTASATLAFGEASGAWRVLHFGGKVADSADAESLAWSRHFGGGGDRRPASYSAYGDGQLKPRGYSFNKFGGLQAVHADGCPTLELVADGAETLPDAPGATHVVLRHRDRDYAFRVVQHVRALESCDVFETWVEIENGEDGPVRLSRMASFAMGLPELGAELRLQSQPGRWGSEAQVVESPVVRGQGAVIGSRNGTRDAWGDNPSFMVTAGPAATESSGLVFGGALCWSGDWEASVRIDESDFAEIVVGPANAAGAYVLGAGETVEMPKFSFTWSSSGKGQVSRNFHRWAREWRLPAGTALRPILLNSWEGSYFTYTEQTLLDMMDGVKEMGGEMFVLDDGWFGRGKYVRDDEGRDKGSGRQGLGDWTVNEAKHPHGLAWLSGEAEKRGLKFGIWVEPEMVNTNSWLYNEHPEWTIRERLRPVCVGRGGSQTVLDFSNPAVTDCLFGQLDSLYSSIPSLAYVKWDANADFYNMGSSFLPADRQSNLPFDYVKGLYSLLARIRAKYPSMDLQACSSGGARLDYGFLGYADEAWGSDDTDARERVFIQWGESQFYPACAIAAHVTASPNHQTGRRTPLKYRFDVAMAARFGFELHPKDLSPDELAFARECVSTYKRIRPTVQQGDLYRLVSPYGNAYAALMYVDAEKKNAAVFVWGLEKCDMKNFVPPVRLAGLDASKRYAVRELNVFGKASPHSPAAGKTLGGDALMSMGVPVRLSRDYDSAVFELSAE